MPANAKGAASMAFIQNGLDRNSTGSAAMTKYIAPPTRGQRQAMARMAMSAKLGIRWISRPSAISSGGASRLKTSSANRERKAIPKMATVRAAIVRTLCITNDSQNPSPPDLTVVKAQAV